MPEKVSNVDREAEGETESETEQIRLARRKQLIQSIPDPKGIHLPAEASK